MIRFVLATDGGCAPKNPGDGHIAYILRAYDDDNNLISETCTVEYIGPSSNNRAEIIAIFSALSMLDVINATVQQPYDKNVVLYSDSLNAINWITGEFRINDPYIEMLVRQVQELIAGLRFTVTFSHVYGHQMGTNISEGAKLNLRCDTLIRDLRAGRL